MKVSWPSTGYDQQVDIICKELMSAKNIFCIAHPHADGDALGSQLALYHFCKSTGKNCICLNFDPISEQISWLDGNGVCRDTLPEDIDFDLAFLMETTEASRMGDRINFFQRAKTCIHLDHHVDITGLGKINLLDPTASSTCEILYNIFEKTGVELPIECCVALYVGIMTDTGNFRYSNSTSRSHEIAAKLIEHGIEVNEIYKKVYENTNYNRVVIHGNVMSRTHSLHNGKLIYSWLKLEDFERIGAAEVDADGAIRPISCIKGNEISILFRENKDGKVKMSFRSTGHYDVMEISRTYGGGGHRLAAGGMMEGDLDFVIKQVIETVSKVITDSPKAI